MYAEFLRQLCQNQADIALNVLRTPSIDEDVLFPKCCFSITVASRNVGIAMNSAIDFYAEHHFLAEEIEDEATDRMLPPELESVELPRAQALPEDLLG